jgi:hypothetical protein
METHTVLLHLELKHLVGLAFTLRQENTFFQVFPIPNIVLNLQEHYNFTLDVTSCSLINFSLLAPSSDPGLLGILGSSLPLFGPERYGPERRGPEHHAIHENTRKLRTAKFCDGLNELSN